ncbi:hypothetical protein [Lysobacter enzymogenes]|uniref:hypothetical protein n=1 Tax=Lysobacter enzymogenes TaxID=69 RepID=UPI00111652A3|nr:hypothetical protein [Lysobacter enzymogenes]UZW62358.1 hypothetical protein BV903_008750 [Lysobacter enzymogenes]
MGIDNRIYLSWDEAAEVLGLDREGFRQLLRYKLSPQQGEPRHSWLPALIQSGNLEFFSCLRFGHDMGEPEFRWSNRTSYYEHCSDMLSSLRFSGGAELPLRGSDSGESWEATHDYGSGYGMCFTIYGDSFVVDPEVIRAACASAEDDQHNYLSGLRVAPYDWCADGFPGLSFYILDSSSAIYAKRPRDMYSSVVFLSEDVRSAKAMLSGGGGQAAVSSADSKQMQSDQSGSRKIRQDREQSLLRVIAVLWHMTPALPTEPYSAAQKILSHIEQWGWDGPGQETIARNILKQAADLPGAKIKK